MESTTKMRIMSVGGKLDGKLDRVSTGVPGFDSLVEGGLPKGTNVLITGAPGTGKSIFGLEFLYSGALQGENGVYVVIDSGVELLRAQARQFGMDVDALEEQGKLFFLTIPLDKNKLNIFEMIEKIKDQIGAERVVFDSLAAFAINVDLFTIPLGYAGNVAGSVGASGGGANGQVFYTGNSERRMVSLILEELKNLGTTNLVITYGSNASGPLTMDGVSEFECDGIIQLHNELLGARRIRTIEILKMRDTSHSPYIHDMEITKSGLDVKPAEEVKL